MKWGFSCSWKGKRKSIYYTHSNSILSPGFVLFVQEPFWKYWEQFLLQETYSSMSLKQARFSTWGLLTSALALWQMPFGGLSCLNLLVFRAQSFSEATMVAQHLETITKPSSVAAQETDVVCRPVWAICTIFSVSKALLKLLGYKRNTASAELKVRWGMRDCNTACQERGDDPHGSNRKDNMLIIQVI